jgi:hypothetical protein
MLLLMLEDVGLVDSFWSFFYFEPKHVVWRFNVALFKSSGATCFHSEGMYFVI